MPRLIVGDAYSEIAKDISLSIFIIMEMNGIYSREKATVALQRLIQEWLEANPEVRNVTGLAREAGVSESCIRRVMTNNAMPTPENLFKILWFIKNGLTHGQILAGVESDLASHLKHQLSYLQLQEVQQFLPLGPIEKSLPTFHHQVLFERSSMGNGISLEEVRSMYGTHGLSIVKELKESNLVVIDNDFVIVKPELKNHYLSTEKTKEFVANCVRDFYKTESQINFLFLATDAVSVEGYSKIMEVLIVTQANIRKLVAAHPGQIPLAVGGFMDTLTFENVFPKKDDSI